MLLLPHRVKRLRRLHVLHDLRHRCEHHATLPCYVLEDFLPFTHHRRTHLERRVALLFVLEQPRRGETNHERRAIAVVVKIYRSRAARNRTEIALQQSDDLLLRAGRVLDRHSGEGLVGQRGQRDLPQRRVRQGHHSLLPVLLDRAEVQRVREVQVGRGGFVRNAAVVKEAAFAQHVQHRVVVLEVRRSEADDLLLGDARYALRKMIGRTESRKVLPCVHDLALPLRLVGVALCVVVHRVDRDFMALQEELLRELILVVVRLREERHLGTTPERVARLRVSPSPHTYCRGSRYVHHAREGCRRLRVVPCDRHELRSVRWVGNRGVGGARAQTGGQRAVLWRTGIGVAESTVDGTGGTGFAVVARAVAAVVVALFGLGGNCRRHVGWSGGGHNRVHWRGGHNGLLGRGDDEGDGVRVLGIPVGFRVHEGGDGVLSPCELGLAEGVSSPETATRSRRLRGGGGFRAVNYPPHGCGNDGRRKREGNGGFFEGFLGDALTVR